MTPQISVIIATYNAESYISKAVRSAANQDGPGVEIIVVDDGSSDQTAAIVRAMASQDGRVRLLTGSEPGGPQGPSAARNQGIEQARGDWIAILDADDRFVPGRLAALIYEASSRGLDALADNLLLYDFATGERRGKAFPEAMMSRCPPIDLAWMLDHDTPGRLDHMAFGYCKPIIRRDALKRGSLRYHEDVRIGEDFLLYAELVLSGAMFGVSSSALYEYAVRSTSASYQLTRMSELVEVNRRIAASAKTSLRQASDPGTGVQVPRPARFAAREQALWYEQFANAVKRGRLALALEASAHLRLSVLIRRGLASAWRRLQLVACP